MFTPYSEDSLIEQPSMEILQNLGWDTSNVYKGETFGENGTLGRDSIAQVILKYRFLTSIKKLNPNLPEKADEQSFIKLKAGEL